MTRTLYATMHALPGREESLLALLRALAVDVREEAGCARFVVYTQAANPRAVHVEETYRDEQAFQAHIATDHCAAFNKAIIPLVEGGGSAVVFLDLVC